jgi:hypothetical protein
VSRKKYTPFLFDPEAQKKLKKRRSHQKAPKAQEKKVAEAIGGRRQSGSGSQEGAKGDNVREHSGLPLVGECKRTTGKKSISVKVEWLSKITAEATAQHAYPFLDIQFDEDVVMEVARKRGELPPDNDWVMVPLSLWRLILEQLGEEGVEG